MQRIKADYIDPPQWLDPVGVAIGNFDGIHLGHQKLLAKLFDVHRVSGTDSAVLTFSPHPKTFFGADTLPRLFTQSEQESLLADRGVDLIVEQNFDLGFSKLSPSEFIKYLISIFPKIKSIVVGENFRFASGRLGSVEDLEKLFSSVGVEVFSMPLTILAGSAVSSTRIRELLVDGDVMETSKLLGFNYFYSGKVVRGDQRGRTIGFPTANLEIHDKVLVKQGVYQSTTKYLGVDYPSITNVGVRPTFKSSSPVPVVETHLLDQDLDMYDNFIKVELIKAIREERKFSGIESLREQIMKDIELVKKMA